LKKINNIILCEKCLTTENFILNELENDRIHLDKSIVQITDKIFLGNYYGARDYNLLSDLKITNILICGNNLFPHFPDSFKYYKLHLDDSSSQSIAEFFEESNKFIDQSERVLIHCAAGRCRSVSFIIAYLMRNENCNFYQAYKLIKMKKSNIFPNDNFIKQLKLYEKYINIMKKTFKYLIINFIFIINIISILFVSSNIFYCSI